LRLYVSVTIYRFEEFSIEAYAHNPLLMFDTLQHNILRRFDKGVNIKRTWEKRALPISEFCYKIYRKSYRKSEKIILLQLCYVGV